ncbi:EutP/PduV family microcompartment system protein [Neobacillus sp. OS1-32]|uniref:EutP/PduV family microcompartment system protein n=1 Tax=Neobacillus sp. OS1-32 TaxID=3070682 RepID=UPI0027E1C14B|nr:EutP/PduV family microcompartment system protein [Neobacillus sp. OS1-32]WML28979.1 EutP/PduV family microcompartment system protein [Neobacillus sp. OS1-32]
MKKIILIGKTGSGKTTLCQKLHGKVVEYQKTQTINPFEHAIDTPGEYIENRFYYKALIVTAADADVIVLVQDCTEEDSFFPPSFAAVFPKPIIGIVTKIDLANNKRQVKAAEEHLQIAGAEKLFHTSVSTGKGIEELRKYLELD